MDLVRYRVLGPLAAVRGSDFCALGGVRQQMVLAVLLANCNRFVSQDALIDAVWDGRPPAAARTSLHTYISNLRRVLGNDQIGHSGHGYQVEADETTFDALQFERLAGNGHALRTMNPIFAAAVLEEALKLWRGPPYGDLGGHAALAFDVDRLDELRLSVEEDRIESLLVIGEHDLVIGRLQVLTREHPFRERFVAQLMLALYRSGRQADALHVFRDCRLRFGEELGIDPSDELWRLEEQILNHEPLLAVPGAQRALTLESPSGLPAAAHRRITPIPPVRTLPAGAPVPTSARGGHPLSLRPRRRVFALALLLGLVAVSAVLEFRGPEILAWSPLPPGCAPPPAGMTAWWTADNTTGDELGNRDAKLVNGATFDTGVVNQAFDLNGRRSWVEIAHHPALDAGTGDFTVDLWVNFDNTEGEQVLVEKWEQGAVGTSTGWTLQKIPGNRLAFFQEGGGEQSPGLVSPVVDIPSNTWLHVAARRAGPTIDILVNGALASAHSGADVRLDVDSDSSLKFGHRGGLDDTPGVASNQGFYLNGRIDEVHLSIGRALTHEEVKAIADAGDKGLCRPDPAV